jgi:ArsR family transcriptional regulator
MEERKTTWSTERAARAFRALGDEKRLRIVKLLSGGAQCVCDLAEKVGAKQPLLSFHLKILREAGLVVATRRGKWIYYSLNDELLGELEGGLARLGETSAAAVSTAEAGAAAAVRAEAGCC